MANKFEYAIDTLKSHREYYSNYIQEDKESFKGETVHIVKRIAELESAIKLLEEQSNDKD